MKTLLIDNYDSFTFNLCQLLAEVNGVAPVVVRNDEMSWEEIAGSRFDSIILSPGPGRADVPRDFGVCTEVVKNFQGPLLGVCLGHQGICHVYGGKFDYANIVMHGQTSRIHHIGKDLFAGIPQAFEAVRYHSLVVTHPGEQLIPTAWTQDGILMAVRHRSRPVWGVQFHPESICTQYGHALLENFRDLALQTQALRRRQVMQAGTERHQVSDVSRAPKSVQSSARPLTIFHRKINTFQSPEVCFSTLYAKSEVSFWLDSSLETPNESRFSFMGDISGPLAEHISYDVRSKRLVRRTSTTEIVTCEPIFDSLKRWLMERQVSTGSEMPFSFLCGWVGYFGYEVKEDCGAARGARSQFPDAQLIFADRLVIFDHRDRAIWLLCCDYPDQRRRASLWFDRVERLICSDLKPLLRTPHENNLVFRPYCSDSAYARLIEAAKIAIRRGETYEVCLTNEFIALGRLDALAAYRELRRRNPAPYSAFLRFADTVVLSASPERFLRIEPDGNVETKPIKGTIRRGRTGREDAVLAETLRTSVKDRSENLMIVDLLRNDLGRVCEIGSVNVPVLFGIETFATVHQLVSTIRGRIRRGLSPIDCVRAAFPGGSMTGAPKLRTMEILDSLEKRARGIYSGTIGYISLCGAVDLSIVIRTAVIDVETIRVGAGGAIVDLSDPDDEIAEVKLKTKAILDALGGELAKDLSATSRIAEYRQGIW